MADRDRTHESWQRLGRLLVARRVALGHRVRVEFARANGFKNDRVLHDIEAAKRTNYEAATLAQIEQAYRWGSGSIAAVLNGGEPRELDTAGNDRPAGATDTPDHGTVTHSPDLLAVGSGFDPLLVALPDSALPGWSKLSRLERDILVLDLQRRAAEFIAQHEQHEQHDGRGADVADPDPLSERPAQG